MSTQSKLYNLECLFHEDKPCSYDLLGHTKLMEGTSKSRSDCGVHKTSMYYMGSHLSEWPPCILYNRMTYFHTESNHSKSILDWIPWHTIIAAILGSQMYSSILSSIGDLYSYSVTLFTYHKCSILQDNSKISSMQLNFNISFTLTFFSALLS